MNIRILTVIVSLLVPTFANAGSATWSQNAATGDWNTNTNWVPTTVPNGLYDIASFGPSTTTTVSISDNTLVDDIGFSSDAPAYTFTVPAGLSLFTLRGIGTSSATQTFINNGGTVSGARGGSIGFQFSGPSNATLVANGGTNGGGGGEIFFYERSTGGTARIELFGNGYLDISGHGSSTGLIVGSIEGNGNIFLGANNLAVGSNNLSTTFSGMIQNGGYAGGSGGSLRKIGFGTLTLSGANTYTGPTNVVKGTLNLTGSLTDTKISINGGILNETTSGVISGSSSLTLQSISATLSGANTYSGTTTVNGGVLEVDGLITSNTSVNKGTLKGTGTVNGNITNSATLSVSAVNGNVTNNGTISVANGGKVDINGQLTNFDGSTNTLTGGIYAVNGTLQFTNANIVTNAGNITLTGTSSSIVNQSNANALTNFAINNGSFALAGSRSLTTAGSFTNAGVLTIATGSTFSLGSSGVFTQSAGSTIDNGTLSAAAGLNLNGGSLFGKGSITGGLMSSSSGIISPGTGITPTGILKDKGAYTQNSGTLDISINGATAGSKYDQFNPTTANLSGTLNVMLGNGFVPSIGNTFKIMNFTSETGTFATVNGLAINSSEHFAITYQPADVLLTVVSGAMSAAQPAFNFSGAQVSNFFVAGHSTSSARGAETFFARNGSNTPTIVTSLNTPSTVPDHGSTLLLMTSGLLGLTGYRRHLLRHLCR